MAHDAGIYGSELSIVGALGIGPTMAAAVLGCFLYTAGAGTLRTWDVSDPAHPRLLGSLSGLGNTRQIAVDDGVAYITARERGLFIVDVATPEAPRLLCHYDPIEVATGVAVAGDVLAVACRSHGVEFVDVTQPAEPRHLSVARTGEAQSVAIRGGYAYVGVWGSSELVVVDIHNPRAPAITARCPLDGYGDGVFVDGERVYVATGHHSRARVTPHPGPGDPGYGRGHGLEIFSIARPEQPEFIARLKAPAFYRIGPDMWSVRVAGAHAFLADTHNGVFVVDIADPRAPRFVGHRLLPEVVRTGLPGYVGGIALTEGHIYAAGGDTDLHIIAAPGSAAPVIPAADLPPAIPPAQPVSHPRFRVYRSGTQVHDVAIAGDVAMLAAGAGGVEVVRLYPEFELLQRCPTDGFAVAVAAVGELACVAEFEGGMSVWRMSPSGHLQRLGCYQAEGRIVRDVVVPAPGRYALVRLDMSILDIVDLSNPANPARVYRDKRGGFLYHVADELLDGESAVALWQLGGLWAYNLYGSEPLSEPFPIYTERIGMAGAALVDDCIVVPNAGRLHLFRRDDARWPERPLSVAIPGGVTMGHPSVDADKLYLSSPTTGDIQVIDLTDRTAPRSLERFNIAGNPARVLSTERGLVIANGYEGLWVERPARP